LAHFSYIGLDPAKLLVRDGQEANFPC